MSGKLMNSESYRNDYNVDTFMSDLLDYFDNEVDLNLTKIRQIICETGRLEQLIIKAKEKNSHPVTEFVKDLFKEASALEETEKKFKK